MKKLMLLFAMLSLGTLCWAGSAREDATDRLDNAAKVLHEIMATPDKGIPEEVLEHAKCVAVVPNMVKGGFILGGKHGKGVATCRTANGWSAPAFFTVGGGSAGLQIGLEGVDLVMIIQNQQGMEHLLASKFQIGGEASAAAGPVGRHASADTDWKMDTEILTYSRAKGAFAGLTLEGAEVIQDEDSTRAMYGSKVTTRSALSGQVPAPPAARAFLSAVGGPQAEAIAEPAHTQIVAGCLQKGDEPGELSITDENGKTWDLHSTNVKLDEHLGHKVTVTGSTTYESKAEEKREGEVEKASRKGEYADLDVTSLKMVSETCK